jgi:hypothetical protein
MSLTLIRRDNSPLGYCSIYIGRHGQLIILCVLLDYIFPSLNVMVLESSPYNLIYMEYIAHLGLFW